MVLVSKSKKNGAEFRMAVVQSCVSNSQQKSMCNSANAIIVLD